MKKVSVLVAVLNLSGMSLTACSCRVKPVRELKDPESPQIFELPNEETAKSFLVQVNAIDKMTAEIVDEQAGGEGGNGGAGGSGGEGGVTEPYTQESLKALKVSELKDICKQRGMKGYSSLKEAELIEAILTHQQDANDNQE